MTNPKPCVFDRSVGYRATIGEHDDDCTDPQGHRGCTPCTHGHCSICGRAHTTHQHPLTCPECVGAVREDITEIQDLCRRLPEQAANASQDGRPWAAAPIPGADAMVMMSPAVDMQQVRVNRDHAKHHRARDMTPPLAVLAHWQEVWAAWLGIKPAADLTAAAAIVDQHQADWLGIELGQRASIARAAGFLDRQLTLLAQQTMTMRAGIIAIPPEFPEFARDLSTTRVQLEQVLHDETTHEKGVDCFECGAQLVRRIRDPKACRHKTPARDALAARMRDRVDAAAWLEVLRTYRIPSWPEERDAARIPSPEMVTAARLPCERCDQGGIKDPRPGISWECPSCRKQYDPGEYANAVRRDLADRQDGDGWTDINLAADAAATLVHHPVLAVTVRKWMDRGTVSGCCVWSFDHLVPCMDPVWHTNCRIASRTNGQRLVFWPDVADEAVASKERARLAAIARDEKARRDAEKRLAEEAKDAALAAEVAEVQAS